MGAPRRRLAPRLSLALVVAGSLLAILPGPVAAVTVKELTAYAEASWSMVCSPPAKGEVECNHRQFPWRAVIRPETGPVQELLTYAQDGDPPLDPESVDWMTRMHAFACGDEKAVGAFVQAVADLQKPGASLGPTIIGPCTFTGSFLAPATASPFYVIRSVAPPPPSPTPPPSATPRPTATPTAAPTATPTAAPSASSSIAPSIAPSGSPTAEASPSAEASQSTPPSESPGGSPTPSPVVAGETAGPRSSEPPAGEPPAGPGPPSFSQSVLAATHVNDDPATLAASLVLALLLLLFVGFVAELFDNTVQRNYDEISGWFRKGPLGWLRRVGGRLTGRRAGIGLIAFVAVAALINALVDPAFGLDLASVAIFLGFLIGLIVVLVSFELPPMLAHRRKTGELGQLRPLPWALVIAGLFVLISRIGDLQPGYLYGVVLGVVFTKDVDDREEGRETFYGALWMLGVSVLAWLGLGWLEGADASPDGFGNVLLTTALAAIFVAGLEATAFGLLPMRFLPGHSVYRWNRLAWGLLLGLSIFAFLHILIGPTSGYLSELSPDAFVAALGVFALFGAVSIGTWGYFRFRPAVTPPA